MKITRENLKNIVREAMVEENAYQEFFKKALEKTGKSIPQMSDDEKKAFFNKIDSAWKGKGEKNEGNAFGAAVADAKKDGDDSFKVGGNEYKVESNEEDLDEEAVVVSKRTPEGNIVSKLKEELESVNEKADPKKFTKGFERGDVIVNDDNSRYVVVAQRGKQFIVGDNGERREFNKGKVGKKKLKGNLSLKNVLGESVNEGKKRFNQQSGIGKSKYVVNYHDGVKKHKDGSDFFDIKIFKNKPELEAFKKDLVSKGFVKESVNEAFKHIIKVDKPSDIKSTKVKKEIETLAKKGIRSKEIGLSTGFVGDSKSANGEFQKVKNRIYFDLDKRNESVNEAKGNPKFKVGNKVNYIPKLSGLNPKKKLEIIRVRYEDGDRFTKPGWYYSFKGMNLSSAEKDIKLAESTNERMGSDKGEVGNANFNNRLKAMRDDKNSFVAFIDTNKGKKLLKVFKTQQTANQFVKKNMDTVLNTKGIESIGTMSKKEWDAKEAKYAIESVNEEIKVGSSVTVNYPTLKKPIKGKVAHILKSPTGLVYVLAGGRVVWDSKNVSEQ